jgi:hypothetical protein
MRISVLASVFAAVTFMATGATADDLHRFSKAEMPFLVISKRTSSGWCQVCPEASWGGAGMRPSGLRLRQSG